LYQKINISNLTESLINFKFAIDKISDNNIIVEKIAVNELTSILLEKYFSIVSPIKTYLEEMMVLKGLQSFMREFSEEMTFRDFNKIKGENQNDDSGTFI
jgi:hypothetical protein